jgi:2-desacetyl-2-hydroxyethyl bacteriochlorophyllide A dehydrogenase
MTGAIHTRQLWLRSPGDAVVLDRPIEAPVPGEVLVEALYSGISRGTESLVFRGEVPDSQHDTMRAPFQEGAFPGPIKYGYSSVGRVIRAPEAEHLEGRTVFCLHPHQDRYVVPAGAVVEVPEGVPSERAVLAANMETALNVVWDSDLSAGDRVVVVGAGVVGSLVAWLAAGFPGAEVFLVDVDEKKRVAAETLGLRLLGKVPMDVHADVVVHATGTQEGAASALDAAGIEGRVVEASWYGTRAVALPLGEAFHARRLTLRSSQVGRLPPSRAPRWTHRRRLSKALELLGSEALDALISGESPFEDLPEALAAVSEHPGGVLCHRVRYVAADAT